jgi:ATP/ADP translocase
MRLIERLVPLQRHDATRGSLLFLYFFLIMASYVVARVTGDALFLDKYNPDKLPLADLTIALLVRPFTASPDSGTFHQGR